MRLPLPQFATKDRNPDRIAEVIETSTTEFVAQCLEPEDLSFPVMPPFGSWVKAEDEESKNQIYGVVYYATTSPIDSVHRARALGLSLAELREEQPQIFAMLKTEFRVAIVGFERPPERLNGHGESRGKIYQLRMRDRTWLVEAGRSLSVLLKDDYDRLRVILSQIHP